MYCIPTILLADPRCEDLITTLTLTLTLTLTNPNLLLTLTLTLTQSCRSRVVQWWRCDNRPLKRWVASVRVGLPQP